MKNFDDIKGHLRELAEIVNAFKSEAVQLRVVDLVFGIEDEDEANEAESSVQEKPARKVGKRGLKRPAKPVSGEVKEPAAVRRPARASGRGGPATLTSLIDQGFFKKPKTIKDIVEHCELNLATKFKQSDFSGYLARSIRDGKLTRRKNDDSQYEYVQS